MFHQRGGDGRLLLTLHIQPGAKKTEVCGLHGDALKIRLAAPPVDGKANAALLAFVAGLLEVSKAAVSLKSGQTSRRKVVEVQDAPADAVQRLLPDA
ncbi:UPF0235 protein [Azospira sp. I13]|uniref:DUF167 domain-containing protein n=1 Tax=Azospira sp. I13 TaxID=1765050 RepID=UPI000D3F27B5|nr:DUF167 domain-containing protein [Azospira sp. I13]GBG03394.1 UPF0235 protein [Azospira sp. I13]